MQRKHRQQPRKRYSSSPLLIFFGLLATQLLACEPTTEPQGFYTSGKVSTGGTGRYYMDREIAGVMSYRGADWLERADREQTERVTLAIQNMELEPDDVVADIGAGSGFFSRRIARQVPQGEVYAVDIQPEMLKILQQNAADEQISNIRTVLATPKTANLDPNSIDLAFMVDVYHELEWPREVLLELRAALKPDGRLVLLEYRAEDESIPIIPVHKMTEEQARKELAAAGFDLVENRDFLPTQHFLIFSPQKN